MLPLVTKYLLRFKKVCIPNVGTFEIVMRAPELDVANQLISPPVFVTRHSMSNEIPDHQFRFFALGVEKEDFMQELSLFGQWMKERIQNGPFYWKGFGTLRYSASQVLFEPDEIIPEGLQPMAARKVLRDNVQHNVLVGDQQMMSGQVTEALSQVTHKRPWAVIAGWVLLGLALITIIVVLYRNHFQTGAAGLQTLW